MTVCIAAIADLGETVVAITDTMLSVEGTGLSMTADSNIFFKGGGIHKDWYALYSGSVSLPVPIVIEARDTLPEGPLRLAQVVSVFRKAYQKHLAQRVADEVLSPGFDVDSFYRRGLSELGEMGFTEKRRDFEYRMQTDPIMDFLVYGFDPSGHAHIFTVSNPGVVTYHDNEGFWAIGSGQQVGITALMFHQYNKMFPLAWSMYHVCEAKFMAERSPGVGEESFILIMNKNKGNYWYPVKEIAKVKEVWRQCGRPSRPPQAVTLIEGLAKEHEERLKQIREAKQLGAQKSASAQ
jgi:hypothetical protein